MILRCGPRRHSCDNSTLLQVKGKVDGKPIHIGLPIILKYNIVIVCCTYI